MSTYRAIAAWNGHQWDARVEDADHNHRGDVTAESYGDVATNARALLVDQGCDVPDDAGPGYAGRIAQVDLGFKVDSVTESVQ